jgi:hypothetical protein
MRLLALSDAHGNLVAAQKMRAQEGNEFDALVVAGDLGGDRALQLFNVLKTFRCPIMYVYGNWDDSLTYDQPFGSGAHLLHMNSVKEGPFVFVGYSGAQSNWGHNPIAMSILGQRQEHTKSTSAALEKELLELNEKKATIMRKHVLAVRRLNSSTTSRQIASYKSRLNELVSQRDKEMAEARKSMAACSEKIRGYLANKRELTSLQHDVLQLNREQLLETIKKSAAARDKLVVVTHERTPWQYLGGALLHLFGHRYGFSDRAFKATRFINVSALDGAITVRPRGLRKWSYADYRNVSGGSYVVIEIFNSEKISAICRQLPHEYKDWTPLKDEFIHGLPCVPEEET